MKKQATKQIATTTLGRIRADVERIKAIKDIKDTESAVSNFMELQAKMFGIKLEELTAQLEAMKKPTVAGTRVIERQHRLNLANSLATFLGLLNKWKQDGYKNLDTRKLGEAYEQMSILHSHEYGKGVAGANNKRRELFASMSIVWTPFQLADGSPNEKNLMAVYCGGWSDGAKEDTDQYFSRFVPITKKAGYRKDSIAMTIPVANGAKAKQATKNGKGSKKQATETQETPAQ